MLKYHMSEVIKHQKNSVDSLLNMLKPEFKQYPINKNNKKIEDMLDYTNPFQTENTTEEDQLEFKNATIDDFNKALEEAEKIWKLSDIILDCPGAMIVMTDENKQYYPKEMQDGKFNFLHEVAQMSPEHIIVVHSETGKIISCAHTWEFYIARPIDTGTILAIM